MMIMEDELFGKIAWDEDDPSSGIMTLRNGKTVRLSLDVDETEEEAALNTLQLLIAGETQIRHKIAVSMMDRYKDWIDDDITTPEELARRITLTDVLLWEGGGQLYYEADDNLFTDHTICVFFDANGEIEEPELEG
jgi:hypothetical protein